METSLHTKRWTIESAREIYQQSFNDLLFQAQQVHRAHFDPNEIQLSTLCSIKTGACPEDCKYCPQSGHYDTGIEKEKLMSCENVLKQAQMAKDNGATRFCMGAGWRNPPDKALPQLMEMVSSVKALGLETCLTAGMLTQSQADSLKTAGLDYYNHNLDTSPEYYNEIITTRTYQDRLDTLSCVESAGINVCCGGIVNMGESLDDRYSLLCVLANRATPPESVPINLLIPIPGTPLAEQAPMDPIDFVRTIATARIMLPHSRVRLSAGRGSMSDEMQALCFFAGANSIHTGEKLLVTGLPGQDRDHALLQRLGLHQHQLEPSDQSSKESSVA